MPDTTEEQDETMNCGLGIEERELLHSRLRELPETMPPRAVWHRIESQARAEGLLNHSLPPGFKRVFGTGLAAAVMLAVISLPNPFEGSGEQVFPTVPPYSEQASVMTLNTLNALMVESQELEQDLRSLPSQPQLVRAGTAATITQLEDQIAAIDYRLNEAGIGMPPEQMELYWRERVRLMNLLVQLRSAQAQRNAF